MYKDCGCCLFQSGRLAQLVERLPYKQNVGGSIPSAPTISHHLKNQFIVITSGLIYHVPR